EILDQQFARANKEKPDSLWMLYSEILEQGNLDAHEATDGYLGLYLREQIASRYPARYPYREMALASYRLQTLRQLPASVAGYLQSLDEHGMAADAQGTCSAVGHLILAFQKLKLLAEAQAASSHLI